MNKAQSMNQENIYKIYDKQKLALAVIIDNIINNMIILMHELDKAPSIVTSARKARVITIDLQKNFKKFRKISCQMGLK